MLANIKSVNRSKPIIKILFFIAIIATIILSVIVVIYYKRIGLPIDRAWDKNTVVEYINKIAVTPVGETPVIAQVIDPSNLINQNPIFFKEAKKDDYVLVYTTEALIFRTSERKIVSLITIEPNKVNLK